MFCFSAVYRAVFPFMHRFSSTFLQLRFHHSPVVSTLLASLALLSLGGSNFLTPLIFFVAPAQFSFSFTPAIFLPEYSSETAFMCVCFFWLLHLLLMQTKCLMLLPSLVPFPLHNHLVGLRAAFVGVWYVKHQTLCECWFQFVWTR